MKLAIMQPYFFPYIGYWQLIHAVDCFVLFDDVQYMRHGWINRNRILKPGGGWQYIVVPLEKHSLTESIKNVRAHPRINWKERILGQLAHYKKKARYFNDTNEAVRKILADINVQSIADINFSIINKVCTSLDVRREIFLSSEKNFDYENVRDAGEWGLRIAEQMGADEYINPASGAGLFSREKFLSSKIKLSFLRSQEIAYFQLDVFEPSLSIIDVMMFNSRSQLRSMLNKYELV